MPTPRRRSYTSALAGRLVDAVVEVAKLALVVVLLTAFLTFAIFRFTGVNPWSTP